MHGRLVKQRGKKNAGKTEYGQMENMVLVSLSQQMALRSQLDVVANNIANMNTTAYKSESVRFEKYLTKAPSQSPAIGNTMAMVHQAGVIRNFDEGEFNSTGNPFDVAIRGDGFLTVQNERGDILYTRNGHLSVNENGDLVTSAGMPVLDDSGGPITLDATQGNIMIARDGSLKNKIGTFARLGIVSFDDNSKLRRAGNGTYKTKQAPIEAENFEVFQGVLESSNVKGIVEMTNMINIMRSYQSAGKLMDDNQNLEQRAIQRLGRFN